MLRNSFKIKKLENGPRQDDRRVGKEKEMIGLIRNDKSVHVQTQSTFLSFLNTCALFHLWITNMKLASKMKTIKLRMLTLTWG